MESLLADSDSCTTFFFFWFLEAKILGMLRSSQYCVCVLKSFEFDASKTQNKSRSFSTGMDEQHGTITKRPLKLRVVALFSEHHVVLLSAA